MGFAPHETSDPGGDTVEGLEGMGYAYTTFMPFGGYNLFGQMGYLDKRVIANFNCSQYVEMPKDL